MTVDVSKGPRRVVVVGFGAAGLAACQELRARGWSGQLTVLSEEGLAPYDRPPLAKGFLTGTVPADRLGLVSDDALGALEIQLHQNVRATSLDATLRLVTDSAGDDHPYDALVVATGVRPRTLGAGTGPGVHVLRTFADAERLRNDLVAERSLIVVGGGFLGLEVAASARTMGMEVTVVEPLVEPMRDRLGPQLAGRLIKLHRERGVSVLPGTGVLGVTAATEGRGPEVLLVDGAVLRADAILVAVGAEPDTDWLEGSGIVLRNGIVCNEQCLAVPGVWAAGDVARWRHAALGVDLRVEHRMNATEQGRAVAGSILGDHRPFVPVPFVWTDHYDVRIQVAGHIPANAVPELYFGEEAAESFAVEWRGDRLDAVAGWNAVRALMPARRELASTWTSHVSGAAL